MAELLRGKPVADAIVADARRRAESLAAHGVVPKLSLVRVGEDPGDLSYERSLKKRADEAGVAAEVRVLPADASQSQVASAARAANEDATVHGLLLFRPLPDHLDEAEVCELIDPAKDVDGVTRGSLAAVFTGAGDGFAPSTAEACVRLLDHYGIALEGSHAVVVGRSLVVGRPLAQLLMARHATVTTCHSRTRDVAAHCRQADIVVAALGRARALGAACFRAGQTVVDVGINFDASGALCGDVDFAAAEPLVGAITPVPAGVGSVTAAVTIDHVVTAAERAARA